MSLIAGPELRRLIDAGIITGLQSNVNAASIDIRLGSEILIEDTHNPRVVDLEAKESINLVKLTIPESGLIIPPGQVFLAHSMEFFNLPDNISAQFILRSSIARNFLQHMMAGWADAGWHGSQLTMEFKNVTEAHLLRIKPGLRVGQMVFYHHDHAGDQSYANVGNYNGMAGAVESCRGQS